MFRPERFLGDGGPPAWAWQAAPAATTSGWRRSGPAGGVPGRALAMATVHLWLAQLLRSFRWVPSGDRGVDMSERLGMSLEMEKPLICLALPRTSST